MTWHPATVMRVVFGVLVAGMIIAALTTGARLRSARERTLAWALLVFLAWALLGLGWVRSR
jgi:hypothetical protein